MRQEVEEVHVQERRGRFIRVEEAAFQVYPTGGVNFRFGTSVSGVRR